MSEKIKDWEAEDDLRTLARAEEIKADKKRMQRAQKAGKRVLKDKQKEVRTISSIAKPRKMKIEKKDGSTVTIRNGRKKTVKIKKNNPKKKNPRKKSKIKVY
jgi:hypothetical protein